VTGGASIGILWLRRDLRLGDHPALAAALAAHEHVVPVFCFDKRLLHGRHRSGPRTQFLLECLADRLPAGRRRDAAAAPRGLDAQPRPAGGRLVSDQGPGNRLALGERWFMPAFRRIYNPARHQERFDPQNAYVRRYLPELRDVPDEYMREPWTMPPQTQSEAGCLIGEDYPEPIVDHKQARIEALERYRIG